MYIHTYIYICTYTHIPLKGALSRAPRAFLRNSRVYRAGQPAQEFEEAVLRFKTLEEEHSNKGPRELCLPATPNYPLRGGLPGDSTWRPKGKKPNGIHCMAARDLTQSPERIQET